MIGVLSPAARRRSFAEPQAEAKLSNVSSLIAVLHSDALCRCPRRQRNRRKHKLKTHCESREKNPSFIFSKKNWQIFPNLYDAVSDVKKRERK
jgi:hypothetical protein